MLYTKVLEMFTNELWSVVRDYGLGCPKTAYNAPLDKFDQVASLYLSVWLSFYPLGEVIDGDKKKFSLSPTTSIPHIRKGKG